MEIENNETELLRGARFYLPSIKKMRLFVMICAILYTYGTYDVIRDINTLLFGFAFPALYIACGFVVLRDSPNMERRLLRAIGRTAICFAVMFAFNLVMSLIVEQAGTIQLLHSKKFWVDFLLLNICSLPVGSTIWFVQALLYAYIIIYVIYKLKLLNLDIYLAVLCLAVTLISGELSVVFGFKFLGHYYLGGNFLTRALPYLLIGHFIQRKFDFFSKSLDLIRHIYLLAFGIVLTVGEYLALYLTGYKGYIGHLLGMGVIAVAVFLFAVYSEDKGILLELLQDISRYELMIPYFICSPVYYLFMALIKTDDSLYYGFSNFSGVFTLVISLVLFCLYAFARFVIYYLIHRNDDKPEEKSGEGQEENPDETNPE